MNTREAAELIGCSLRHVRTLCTKKKLKAKRYTSPSGRSEYVITQQAVEEFLAQPRSGQGWPRGVPRSKS